MTSAPMSVVEFSLKAAKILGDCIDELQEVLADNSDEVVKAAQHNAIRKFNELYTELHDRLQTPI